MTEDESPLSEPTQLLVTASQLLIRVERALRWYRPVVIALVVAVLLIGAGGAGLYSTQQGQCHAGNAFRASDAANWDDFLDIALGPHPRPEAVRLAGEIRQRIHARDAPRGCSAWPWG